MARKKKAARSKKRVLWTAAHLKTLRKSAGKQSLEQIAKGLNRSAAAVQLKASNEGISLRRR
jgi:hypothetical protein